MAKPSVAGGGGSSLSAVLRNKRCTTHAYSTGNENIDFNGKLTVTGCLTVSVGAGGAKVGFDCDNNTLKLAGGTILGIGGATSLPMASVTTQPVEKLGSSAATTLSYIQSSDGTKTLTFLVPKAYTTMLFSNSKLKLFQAYAAYTGGSVAITTNFNGLYTNGTYMPGTASTTFTTSIVFTQAGGR